MLPYSPTRPGRREAERLLILSHELTRLNQRIDRSILSAVELSPAQGVALDELWRSGSLSMGDVARRLHITAGSATRLVSALQRRGLLRKRASKSDARQSHVELSARGEEIYARVREDNLRAWREMLTHAARQRPAAEILDTLGVLMAAQLRWAAEMGAAEPEEDSGDDWLR
jgi:DNA-binding MarR family transcriptional regulator